MKRLFRFCLFALALLSVFSACSRAVSFSMERGNYRNGKTGAIYTPVSDNYRSVGYFEDALAGTYRSPSGAVTSFYRMEDTDGWLTDGDHRIYLPEGASLPAFGELTLTGAQLCLSNAITDPILDVDKTAAERIRDNVVGGTSFSYRSYFGVCEAEWSEQYLLVFYTSELPVSYNLIYLELKSEVLIYEPLTDSGEIPDLYPGIPVEKKIVSGQEVAVFHFGTQFLYDRLAGLCYPVEKLTSEGA